MEAELTDKTIIRGLSYVGMHYSDLDTECFADTQYEGRTLLPRLTCINPLLPKQVITPEGRWLFRFGSASQLFGDGGNSALSIIRTDAGLCQLTAIPFTHVQRITFRLADVAHGKEALEKVEKNCAGALVDYSVESENGSGDYPETALVFSRNTEHPSPDEETETKHRNFVKALDRFWRECENGSAQGEAALDQTARDAGFMELNTEAWSRDDIGYRQLYMFLRGITALSAIDKQKDVENFTVALKTCGPVFNRYMDSNRPWAGLEKYLRLNLKEPDRKKYASMLKELEGTHGTARDRNNQ